MLFKASEIWACTVLTMQQGRCSQLDTRRVENVKWQELTFIKYELTTNVKQLFRDPISGFYCKYQISVTFDVSLFKPFDLQVHLSLIFVFMDPCIVNQYQ